MTHLETRQRHRRRHRRWKKVKEIVENGVVLTTIALVVGFLIFAFNPQRTDTSSSPVLDGRLLEP